MIKRAYLKGSSINVGNIAQIELNVVDLAKTDCKNLTLIVVEERTFKKTPPLYHLANKLFQLKLFMDRDRLLWLKMLIQNW